MKTGEIVTDEYLQRHFDGASRVITESGYTQKRHEREIMIAQWLCDTFGGNIVLISEDGSQYGEKRADYIWEGKYWELKTVHTLKAIDSSLRKGITQIHDKPGGIILELEKIKSPLGAVRGAIDNRISISCRIPLDIMIIQNKNLLEVIRYK